MEFKPSEDTPSFKLHLPHIVSLSLADHLSAFKLTPLSPTFKIKTKASLDIALVFTTKHLSNYLKQATSTSSHSVYSQFHYNLNFHHYHSIETTVTINFCVTIFSENRHVLTLDFVQCLTELMIPFLRLPLLRDFPVNSLPVPFPTLFFSVSNLYMLGFIFFFFAWVISFTSCSFKYLLYVTTSKNMYPAQATALNSQLYNIFTWKFTGISHLKCSK